MDESEPLEEIRNWEHPPWYGLDQFKERFTLTFLENQKGLFHNLTTHSWMPVKQVTISGPCREASYTALIRIWRLARKQLTSSLDSLWPEFWKSMGKHAKLKEKQKWSEEKLHLENERKLHGICFIDPRIRNSRRPSRTRVRSWKQQWLLLCPIKLRKIVGNGASNKIQTNLACILEADESTRMRMGNSIPHHHEDHITGTSENSLQHYKLVHKFIPMSQAMKIPAAKAAVDKEWEN